MFLQTLNFHPRHIQAILSGKKLATIRLWHTPQLEPDAMVLLIDSHQGTPFAVSQIMSTERKPISRLEPRDMTESGHTETWQELGKKLEQYYEEPVDEDTPVTVVRFKIIEDGQDEESFKERIEKMQKWHQK
jgi:hypothetical protein